MKKIINRLAIISITLLVVMFTFSAQIDAIEPGSAMAIWLLDEGNGKIINDSSGNENHGELKSGKWVDGPSGTALSLNGNDDRVIIPDSDSLYADKAWTITAWVYVNGAENGYGHIVGKRAAAGAVANYAFRTSPDGKQWDAYFSRGGWKGVWRQGSVKKDTWLYMTATYDGVNTIKLYENGTEFSSTDGYGGPPPRDTSEVNIGGWTNNTSETLNGMLYDVAVFNVALSEADINELMDKGLSGLLPVEPAGKLAITWGSIKSRK
ncbi:MAG: LamG domain-containing protein [Candidatus Poribacteria bacterium]|nr:LamG domain-containing protein [Candidatus Poribacteria bacterium]